MMKLMTTDFVIGKDVKNGCINNLINLVTCPKRYEVSM